jgi:hypothetical protein
LALISPTSGGFSVGIVRLRTTGDGVCYFVLFYLKMYLNDLGFEIIQTILRLDLFLKTFD